MRKLGYIEIMKKGTNCIFRDTQYDSSCLGKLREIKVNDEGVIKFIPYQGVYEYDTCTPIVTEKYVKSRSVILDILINSGYTIESDGCFVCEGKQSWTNIMWRFCGEPLQEATKHGYELESEWIEEKEC